MHALQSILTVIMLMVTQNWVEIRKIKNTTIYMPLKRPIIIAYTFFFFKNNVFLFSQICDRNNTQFCTLFGVPNKKD